MLVFSLPSLLSLSELALWPFSHLKTILSLVLGPFDG